MNRSQQLILWRLFQVRLGLEQLPRDVTVFNKLSCGSHLHWLSRYEKFFKWRKAQCWMRLNVPIQARPFSLFYSLGRINVEQNLYSSAPAWSHDLENGLSALKTSTLFWFGEAEGPVSLLQHSLSQMRMSGYEEIVTFGAGAHYLLNWRKALMFRAVELISSVNTTFTPSPFLLFKGFVTWSSCAAKRTRLLRRWKKTWAFLVSPSPESSLVEK